MAHSADSYGHLFATDDSASCNSGVYDCFATSELQFVQALIIDMVT